MIDCDATECAHHGFRDTCKLERTNIRVNTGAMSKEQYSAECDDFMTRKELMRRKRELRARKLREKKRRENAKSSAGK